MKKTTQQMQLNKIKVKNLINFISKNRNISFLFLPIMLLVISGFLINYQNNKRNILNKDLLKSEQLKQTEKYKDELDKLKITQNSIVQSHPIFSKNGLCNGMLYSENNGIFSVAVRKSDGSMQCLSYNLNDLQNNSLKNNTSVVKSSINGQTTTTLKSTDENGNVITTKIINNADGSSSSSTTGDHIKVILGPTNDGREIFAYFAPDPITQEYYTTENRFTYCYTTLNEYSYSDGKNYWDGTIRELSAEEKNINASIKDCGKLPVLQYESANYDLTLLKDCLRENYTKPDFDRSTCFRTANKQ